MQYAFVLGRVYTLSLAELLEVLKATGKAFKVITVSKEILIIETEEAIESEKLQARLGGVIKILKIVDHVKKTEKDTIQTSLHNFFTADKIKALFLKNPKGKIQIGISIYLLDPIQHPFGEPNRVGMFIKRPMQAAGHSVRIVLPELGSLTLASVVVTGNSILEKGAEVSLIVGNTDIYIAKTLRVQDFEDYGRRDYQRPIRDLQAGMIPPKVAQSMLNLAGCSANQAVLDPFCGYGTFLQEGALLGYKMIGTDISRAAVSGSEKNTEWFRNRYKIAKGRIHLETIDARKVSEVTKQLSEIKAIPQVNAVVTEGTLGPAYGKMPPKEEMKKNFQDLSTLYGEVFAELARVLQSGKKVIITLPAYKSGRDHYEFFPDIDFILKNGYNITSLIPKEIAEKYKFLKLAPRGSIVYDRKDQVVAREIIALERQ